MTPRFLSRVVTAGSEHDKSEVFQTLRQVDDPELQILSISQRSTQHATGQGLNNYNEHGTLF